MGSKAETRPGRREPRRVASTFPRPAERAGIAQERAARARGPRPSPRRRARYEGDVPTRSLGVDARRPRRGATRRATALGRRSRYQRGRLRAPGRSAPARGVRRPSRTSHLRGDSSSARTGTPRASRNPRWSSGMACDRADAVMTLLGIDLALPVGNTVVTETVVNMPGLGNDVLVFDRLRRPSRRPGGGGACVLRDRLPRPRSRHRPCLPRPARARPMSDPSPAPRGARPLRALLHGGRRR